ncbi:hypothetical protein TMEN_5353 [Trichophyton mentagrophytes]|nr:hypothetical protein TMEN_5353 [Trichophyton mentagrophytes]
MIARKTPARVTVVYPVPRWRYTDGAQASSSPQVSPVQGNG